jgi:hypothetical protein
VNSGDLYLSPEAASCLPELHSRDISEDVHTMATLEPPKRKRVFKTLLRLPAPERS